MASKIQVRRGQKSELPALSEGEFGLCTDSEELFIGLGGRNMQVGSSKQSRTATIVVAAHNSPIKSQDAADFLCSGADDESRINEAISALPSGGGKIVFLEGDYNISSRSCLNISDNVVLEGMGYSTKFNVKGNFLKADVSTISLKNMYIVATDIDDGIISGYTTGNMPTITIDDCFINATKSSNSNLEFPKALIMNCNDIRINNSTIMLTITNSVQSGGCYAIAEIPTDSLTKNFVRISNSSLKITVQAKEADGAFNAYAVRKGALISNCNINLSGNSQKAKAVVADENAMIALNRIYFDNKYCAELYGGETTIGRCAAVGNCYFAKEKFTLQGNYTRIGYCYDNIDFQHNS